MKRTQFVEYVNKGGSTRPWIVLLKENNVELSYVVKFSNPKDYNNQFPIVKEILGNILAPEFALRVPEYSLVNFSKDFIEYALDDEQKKILSTKHNGIKFATKLLDSAIVYTPSIHRNYLKEYDFANLFAFDVLIYNFDRGRTPEKPNIIIEYNDFILIDHELSLPFIDNQKGLYDVIIKKLYSEEIDYPFQQQLSYSYLKSLRQVNKEGIFDEFEENLSRLNVNLVIGVIEELTKLQIPSGHSERIIEYLYTIKRESRLFCKSLVKCIL